VALGIAGGTLVLVLSANNASLRQSVDARLALRLERQAESKFEEIQMGSELAMHGDLEGLPGWTWEAVRAPTYLKGLKQLRRITFTVQAPDGTLVLERAALAHKEEKHP
jgi:hypothetical protein